MLLALIKHTRPPLTVGWRTQKCISMQLRFVLIRTSPISVQCAEGHLAHSRGVFRLTASTPQAEEGNNHIKKTVRESGVKKRLIIRS